METEYNIIKFKRTWCDYLTPCKNYPNIMVGSYECSECPCFKGFEFLECSHNISETEFNNMSQYFKIYNESIKCGNYKTTIKYEK